ncbi:site-specific integrase [Clostridium hydrogenum]|uniref:site-specific integrase n=1 Tax=Clostridium hydrogenum TaxID=2855764 RepID=UPI001F29B9CC|nr:tyrosine-type recombinase/integrase [Clostridium hydrogenum]
MKGTIIKRKNSWSLVIDLDPKTDGSRNQKWFSGFKTKKEAQIKQAEIITKLQKGCYFETQKMNLSSYLDYWLENYARTNVAQSTFVRYRQFANCIKKHLGNLQLSKLKPIAIQQLYSDVNKQVSNSTVLKLHRFLHLALKHAVKWRIIPLNPTEMCQPPKPKRHEMSVWDISTYKNFKDLIKNEVMFLVVVLGTETGMRLGEILALRWEDISFDSKTIHVTNSLQYINKEFILKEPKTKKSKRSITLMDTTLQVLKSVQYEQRVNKMLFGKDYDNNNFVCCWNTGKPIIPHYISTRFKKLIKKYNLPEIRFHDLRHTHATFLLSQGINPKVVSERLGHSTITLTLDTYSHVLPNMQEEATEKLNKLFCN